MFLTLNQAAKECGRSAGTLSKAVKSGKLSIIEKSENGTFKIDPAELYRVFPPCSKAEKTSAIGQLETPKKQENEAKVDAIERILTSVIEDLRQRLDAAESRAERAEARLDQEREDAREDRDKLVLLLDHKKPEDEIKEQAPPTKRRWYHFKKSSDTESA